MSSISNPSAEQLVGQGLLNTLAGPWGRLESKPQPVDLPLPATMEVSLLISQSEVVLSHLRVPDGLGHSGMLCCVRRVFRGGSERRKLKELK